MVIEEKLFLANDIVRFTLAALKRIMYVKMRVPVPFIIRPLS